MRRKQTIEKKIWQLWGWWRFFREQGDTSSATLIHGMIIGLQYATGKTEDA